MEAGKVYQLKFKASANGKTNGQINFQRNGDPDYSIFEAFGFSLEEEVKEYGPFWYTATEDNLNTRINFQLGGTEASEVIFDAVELIELNPEDLISLNVVAENGEVIQEPFNALGYPVGTEVKLTANPFFGYEFAGWSGDASGDDLVYNITLDSDKTVTSYLQ